MAIHLGWKGTIVPGPTIEIQCPRCGHAGKADSYEQTDCLRVYFITVITIRNTFVRCGHCGRAILCDAELGQLASMHAEAIASAISFRMPSLGRTLAILSLLTFPIPVLGAASGVGAYLLARRASRGWKLAATLGMILGVTVTFSVAVLMYIRP